MKIIMYLISFISLVTIGACKKKEVVEKVYVVKDPENTHYRQGWIHVGYYSYYNSNTSQFDAGAQIYKKPLAENEENLTNIEIRYRGVICPVVSMPYFKMFFPELASNSQAQYDTAKFYFRYPSISVKADGLALGSYIDPDTVLPSLTVMNVTDTLLLSKSSLTTYTVNNIPANYTISGYAITGGRIGDYDLAFIMKQMKPGVNVITFYPDEVRRMLPWDKISVFYYSRKNIFIGGKEYEYDKRYEVRFEVRIVQ